MVKKTESKEEIIGTLKKTYPSAITKSRILAVLKEANPTALTKNAIQQSTDLYWSKIIEMLVELVKEGKIEEIPTSDRPVYRLLK